MAKKTAPKLSYAKDLNQRSNLNSPKSLDYNKVSKKVGNAIRFLQEGKEGPGYEKNLGSLNSSQADSASRFQKTKMTNTPKGPMGRLKKGGLVKSKKKK
jgi:hypothetical protein